MLIGLKGVRSSEIFFSFPSSFNTVPTKTQRPFSGTAFCQLVGTLVTRKLTSVVELELLLCGRDGRKDGKSGDRRSAVVIACYMDP